MRPNWTWAWLGLLAARVWADGAFMEPMVLDRVSGKVGVASTEQKGVIIELPNGREALLLQTTYQGPADRFAWVIPVPGRPQKGDVFLASPEFIDELIDATKPEVTTRIIDPARREGFAGGRQGLMMGEGMPPGGEAGATPPGIAPTVTVHERMNVGDYDVSVLSATGTSVLTGWLMENGYRIPEGSDGIFRHYVEKHWFFVALRVRPGLVEQRPVLQDVAPIGIRFPTKQLVYPLFISRASSRDKTAMLLLLLSTTPVQGDQLPEARLPLRKWHGKGACYAAIRRETIERTGPSAVCEYRGPEAFPYFDLYYQKDVWWGPETEGWSPRFLWTTRYWTILQRDKLDDLTFSRSKDQRTLKLVLSRQGEIHRPLIERVTVTTEGLMRVFALAGAGVFLLASWAAQRGLALAPRHLTGVVIATLVLVAFLLILNPASALLVVIASPVLLLTTLRRSAEPGAEPPPLRWPELTRGALVAAGMGAFGHVTASMMIGGHGFLSSDALGTHLLALWRGETPLPWAAAVGVVQVAWTILAIETVHQGLKGAGARAAWIALPWVVLGAFVAPAFTNHHFLTYFVARIQPDQTALGTTQAAFAAIVLALAPITLAALLLLLAFMVAGPLVAPHARRTAQPLAQTLLVLVVLSALLTVGGLRAAHAGSGGFIATGTRELDDALRTLDDLLLRFRTAHGCYPARLQDLAGTQVPAEGVDSSGNRVPISGAARHRTPVEPGGPLGPGQPPGKLPVDPLTGRNDRWVFEPTGSPMVDSGGYQIMIDERHAVHPEDVAKWKPGQPLQRPGAGQTMFRSYWRPEEPKHATGSVPESLTELAGQIVGATAPVARLAAYRDRARSAWADVASHHGEASESGLDQGPMAAAPDRKRVVYVINGERSTLIHSVYRPDPNALTSELLLRKPWPVEVYDIAWHPRETRWLVVARPLDGDARARLYLVAKDGTPSGITDPGNYVAAQFTADGRGILALRTEAPWIDARETELRGNLRSLRGGAPGPRVLGRPVGGAGHDKPLEGALELLSLDGRRQKVLADGALAWPCFGSERGWLGVAPGAGMDECLLYIDRANALRRIALPAASARVTDLWLGDGELAVAVAKAQPQSQRDATGDVWWYSLGTGEWRLVARWVPQQRGGLADRPDGLMIVGRDRASAAYVLCYRNHDKIHVLAVRDREPRLELLGSPDMIEETKTLKVQVAGLEESVVVEGTYWPGAFNAGDLIATQPGEGTPGAALPVAERRNGTLLVGERRIKLPSGDLPIIGDPDLEFYAKMRRR